MLNASKRVEGSTTGNGRMNSAGYDITDPCFQDIDPPFY
jgi:hypothetical protein